MSSTSFPWTVVRWEGFAAPAGVEGSGDTSPVVAEAGDIRLRLHARELRGRMTLVEAAQRADMNRDELSRLEKGETKQVRFSTLAKLLAAYDCSLDALVEVERVSATVPLYAGALAALGQGRLVASSPRRRAVRRSEEFDTLAAVEEQATLAESSEVASAPRKRRSPVGTAHT